MSTKILCLSEALSPISHASGTVGNESLIAREPVMTRRGMVRVPFLSGNALRHKCVRESGALWLIREYGLDGRLFMNQLNALLHGGAVTQSTAREDLSLHDECARLWPLLKLLGFCLPGQIFPGNLQVWRGTLVCEENRGCLRPLLGDRLPDDRLRGAEAWIDDWQYVRNDAGGTVSAADDDQERRTQLLPFTGQAVAKGSHWLHGFVVTTDDPLQIGALLFSLRLWQAGGGTIGGKAAVGHGRLSANLQLPADVDQDALVHQYVEHVRGVRDEAVEWIYRVFDRTPPEVEQAETADASA